MKIVPKGWGFEHWIVNNELYCGKKLILYKDKQCSIHYHKVKDETFYIQSGIVKMITWPNSYPGEEKIKIMTSGDSLHIPIGLAHRFYGIEDSEIIEFSTQHFDSDSYRHEKGD